MDSVSNRQELQEQFVPQTRLDFHTAKQEPLNRVFAECLQKYIDILGRKGCNRTAVEFCKFFLCLDPNTDPYGNLLRIDFYSIRAKEYKFLLDFIRRFPLEVYPTVSPESSSLLLLPNLLLTSSLAKKLLGEERGKAAGGMSC